MSCEGLAIFVFNALPLVINYLIYLFTYLFITNFCRWSVVIGHHSFRRMPPRACSTEITNKFYNISNADIFNKELHPL